MRLLLDTNTYLWCLSDNHHLSKTIKTIILDAVEVYVSSVSIWEIAIKIKLGKLNVDLNQAIDGIEKSGYLELPLTANHAAATSQLLNIHKDPFDRMLIAQAISEPLKLLTADKTLKNYSDLVEVI